MQAKREITSIWRWDLQTRGPISKWRSHLQTEVSTLIRGPTSEWRSHLLELFFVTSGVITIFDYIKNKTTQWNSISKHKQNTIYLQAISTWKAWDPSLISIPLLLDWPSNLEGRDVILDPGHHGLCLPLETGLYWAPSPGEADPTHLRNRGQAQNQGSGTSFAQTMACLGKERARACPGGCLT